MKNLLYFDLTYILVIILLMSACHDEEDCPKCFEDIVTCKVNGKEWRSNCKSNEPLFGCRAIDCHYYYTEGKGLDISVGNSTEHSSLTLDQFGVWGGAQIGNNSIQQSEFWFTNFNIGGNCSTLDSLDFSYLNYFTLNKIDTTNFIIEGKFGFKVYNNCGDTATITDGYFKTKFMF